MRVTRKLNRGVRIVLLGALAALVLGLHASPGWAETASGPAALGSPETFAPQAVGTDQLASASPMTRRRYGRYFIEFRSRSAASYGHMYVLYGQVNGRGQITKSKIAGLHPAGDSANCYNCSVLPWTIGHLIPVPAETGPSDGDLEEKYVTARYRLWLSAAEYRDVSAYIEKLKADTKVWNALWSNCVGFGRKVAEHMGLQVPGFIWLEPDDFVVELRKLNGGPDKDVAPLKDAPNALGGPEPLPKQVGLPPSRPGTAPVAAKPAIKPAAEEKLQAAAPAAPKVSQPMTEEKVEAKPAMKPAAGDTTPATEGMATGSTPR
jgi:hypothetical protein